LRAPKRTARTASNDYDGLCAAIQAIERKASGKSTVSGIPRASRHLSIDELQRAVIRNREKLLLVPHAAGFLRRVYCHWIQEQKRDALLEVLDGFGCKHN